MSRRRKNTNPYPRMISDRLWFLLHAWAEWRSCKGTPRALPMPVETGKCHIRNGCVIFEPVGAVLEPHSTRPPKVSAVEELNHCMAKLGEYKTINTELRVSNQAMAGILAELNRLGGRDG